MAERRWPSLDEVREKGEKHILDDRMAAVPPYDLEEWEILGLPAPDAEKHAAERPDLPKRTRRRAR